MFTVMARLVLAIHDLLAAGVLRRGCRDKPGHDDVSMNAPPSQRPRGEQRSIPVIEDHDFHRDVEFRFDIR